MSHELVLVLQLQANEILGRHQAAVAQEMISLPHVKFASCVFSNLVNN